MYDKIEKLKQGKADPSEILQSISIEKGDKIPVNYGNKKQPERSRIKSVVKPKKKEEVKVLNNTQITGK